MNLFVPVCGRPLTRPVLEFAAASVKSAAILTRGWRALQAAMQGVMWMAVEDSAAASRALLGARNPREFLDIEACVIGHSAGRNARRSLVLSAMAVEVLEDASVPLVRGASNLMVGIRRAAAA